MTHLSDEQLILHHYGELDDEQVVGHLATCAECRREADSLAAVLGAVDEQPAPEVPPHFAERLWWRLRPRLGRPADESRARPWARSLARAAAIAALVGGAFVAGRLTQEPLPDDVVTVVEEAPIAPQVAADAKRRVLELALDGHVDRCQVLLVDLVNRPAEPVVDLTGDRRLATDLLRANRLYRLNAMEAGDWASADLLSDLELLLLELAHGPEVMSGDDLERLVTTTGSHELLFKLRLASAERAPHQRSAGRTAGGSPSERSAT